MKGYVVRSFDEKHKVFDTELYSKKDGYIRRSRVNGRTKSIVVKTPEEATIFKTTSAPTLICKHNKTFYFVEVEILVKEKEI